MAVDLGGYIESILNPNGRFRTLEGIYAVVGEDGEPRMAVTNRSVGFCAVWNGAQCVLRCFFDADAERRARLGDVSLYTSRIDSRYLSEFRYLDSEMLVFDAAGQPVYVDAAIEKVPVGVRMDEQLATIAASGDAARIASLMRGLADMAGWLAANDFSHGNICAKNIFITGDGTPVLADYTKSARTASRDDLRALAALAAATYITACDPALYEHMVRGSIGSVAGLSKLTRMITDIMDGEQAQELKAVLDCVIHGEEASPEAICAAISALAGATPHPYKSLENIASRLHGAPMAESDKPQERYVFIGTMNDMLMRVYDGNDWSYIDRHGNVALPGPFISAGDFCEGRAVVETATGHGLIDLDGRFVMEPLYEDMEWDGPNNIVIATVGGLSGTFTRDGEPLTGIIYDQILACSEGLLAVKSAGRFGYIRRDGIMAIRPQYDDAFGFRDGAARVRIANRRFVIDPAGNPVANVPQQHPENI